MGEKIVIIINDFENERMSEILDLFGEKQVDVKYIDEPIIMSFEGLIIYTSEKQVKVDEIEIYLSKTEYEVLYHLARYPGWVRSKRQLFEAIWPPEAESDYHTVETVIYTLRKKIDPNTSNPRFIKTVHGHGYRFIGKKIT